MATSIMLWFHKATKRRFFRFGIPFIICIVGGSFALKQFASVRYDFRKGKQLTNEEAEKYGIKMKKKEDRPTLEDIYKEIEKSDLDAWENIRGPRPWEDSKTLQDLQRQNKHI